MRVIRPVPTSSKRAWRLAQRRRASIRPCRLPRRSANGPSFVRPPRSGRCRRTPVGWPTAVEGHAGRLVRHVVGLTARSSDRIAEVRSIERPRRLLLGRGPGCRGAAVNFDGTAFRGIERIGQRRAAQTDRRGYGQVCSGGSRGDGTGVAGGFASGVAKGCPDGDWARLPPSAADVPARASSNGAKLCRTSAPRRGSRDAAARLCHRQSRVIAGGQAAAQGGGRSRPDLRQSRRRQSPRMTLPSGDVPGGSKRPAAQRRPAAKDGAGRIAQFFRRC